MKKMLFLLLTSSCLLSLAGCPSPSTSNPSSSANPSSSSSPSVAPSTTPTGNTSKASFIAYLTCIKTKAPEIAPAIDAHITAINNMNDTQWASSISIYQAITKSYAMVTECKF